MRTAVLGLATIWFVACVPLHAQDLYNPRSVTPGDQQGGFAEPTSQPFGEGYVPPPATFTPKIGSTDRGNEYKLAGNRYAGDSVVANGASRRQAAEFNSSRGAVVTTALGQLEPVSFDANQEGALGAIGPGDTLAINIMGIGGLQARVTVDADGYVVVPLLGRMKVAGLDPGQISQLITITLQRKKIVNNPQVAVEVLTLRSRTVSVLGEVAHPGRYSLEGQVSVLELIAMAGGTTDSAGQVITLVRHQRNGQDERIALYVDQQQSPSELVQNTDLQPGDVVFVPQAPRFYVFGDVGKPGAYFMEPGLTVMRALSLAGGLTPRASDSRIDIDHTDPKTGQVTVTRVKMTDHIGPGDVLHVHERIF